MANIRQEADFTPTVPGLGQAPTSRDSSTETLGSDEHGPPTKKSKRTTAGGVMGFEGASPTFSPFADMPFDVLFEICQYLRPGDLVNLCDASPLCWRMLCTKSAAFIWVNCRELDGLYDIPDGMSEYYWAKLFYSTRCMRCNVGQVKTPDFVMRRRLFDACREEKYIGEHAFHDHFGRDVDVDVLHYIPCAKLNFYSLKKYCKDDVANQLKTLSALKRDVLIGKRDAHRKLERYKASRTKLLWIMKAEAAYFDKCYEREARRLQRQEERDIWKRYQEVEQRFLDFGYLLEDFPPYMQRHHLLRKTEKLTDEGWEGIQNEFEPEFRANKELREQGEWQELVLDRRRLLDDAYVVHKLQRIAPPLWKFLPQIHHLIKLQPFHDLIECDKSRTLTKGDFVPLLERLEQIIGPAYEEARTRLREQSMSSEVCLYSDLKTSNKFRNLELATMVFRCTHCKLYLFAWNELKSHYCVHPGLVLTAGQIKLGKQASVDVEDFDAEFPYAFEFCEDGGDAMILILSVLGLDSAETTTAELDASDTRFLCGHKHGNKVPSAFTWRGLATHLLNHHRRKVKDKTVPPPKKITSRNRRPGINQVKRVETQIMNDYALWACAKCDRHLASGQLGKPAYVKEHLKDHHGTARPQEGVDYVDLSDYKLFSELARGLDIDIES